MKVRREARLLSEEFYDKIKDFKEIMCKPELGLYDFVIKFQFRLCC